MFHNVVSISLLASKGANMYYVTYDKDGILQHLRKSETQCASQNYIAITDDEAEILKQEGEFHRWRMDVSDPIHVFYRLPDCDPKYHVTINGRVTEMTDSEKAAVDAVETALADREAMEIRIDRNSRLAACDWTQLIDCPLNSDTIRAWMNYRQDLRDITTQPGFPDNVTWPEQP